MASTETGAPKPKTVSLDYNLRTGKVTSTPSKPTFHKGDLVEFVSVNGGDVYVKLNSESYKPDVFRPKGPVTVMKDPSGTRSKAECGFVMGGIAYGWIPEDVRSKGNYGVPKPIGGFNTDP